MARAQYFIELLTIENFWSTFIQDIEKYMIFLNTTKQSENHSSEL